MTTTTPEKLEERAIDALKAARGWPVIIPADLLDDKLREYMIGRGWIYRAPSGDPMLTKKGRKAARDLGANIRREPDDHVI